MVKASPRRTAPRLVFAALAVLTLTVAGNRAGAQDLPFYPVDLARPLPAPQQSLSMLDRWGEPLPMLAPRFSLALLGGRTPLRYREGDVLLQVDQAWSSVLGLALGFGRADLGVSLPINLSIAGDNAGEAWRATALGDAVLVPRVAVTAPGRGPVALVLSVPVTLPTGDEQAYSGRGGLTTEPRALVCVHGERFGGAVRLGLRLQGGQALALPHLGNWLTLRAAVGVALGPGGRIRPEIGVDGVLPLDRPADLSAEVLGGATVRPVGGLAVGVHGGMGAGPMPGIASARLAVLVSWEGDGRRSTRDGDGDGIRVPGDACPELAEDRDGFEDGDGCPDPDNDGDGRPDPADACPDQAGPGWSGCPAPATVSDLDQDGRIEDDRCPLQPEDMDGFEDDDGCPEAGPP